MLKIDSDKIWKLVKKDKRIQKELQKFIEKEQKKWQEATSIYQAQVNYINSLKQKQEYLSKEEDGINQKIVHLHGDISFLEIKKLFAQARLKRLIRVLKSLTNAKKRKKYEKYIQKEKDYLNDLERDQSYIKDEIQDFEKQKDLLHTEQKDLKITISKAYDELQEDEDIMSYWAEEKNKKETRFYQAAYEEVSENFKPCQDLVVPDLETSKKMTKQEAKKKANPILIDEEYILADPEQLKIRRLTKDEKEEFRKSA